MNITMLTALSKVSLRRTVAGMKKLVRFHDGRGEATDGVVTLNVAAPGIPNVCMYGDTLARVCTMLEMCGEVPAWSVGDDKVTVRAGRSRVTVPVVVADPPLLTTDDLQWQPCTDAMRQDLLVARSFVSEDATRPWTQAVHCTPHGLFATNNIIAAVVMQDAWPTCVIPHFCIDALLGAPEPVTHVAVRNGVLYAKGDDMRMAMLLTNVTPEDATRLQQVVAAFSTQGAVMTDANLIRASLDTVWPFVCDDTVAPVDVHHDGQVRTSGDVRARYDAGASTDAPLIATFSAHHLRLVVAVATHVSTNLSHGGRAVAWTGRSPSGASVTGGLCRVITPGAA